MRRFFLVFFGTVSLADLVTWLALEPVLGRLGAPGWARWGVGVFLLLQIAGMTTMVGARLLGHQPGTGMGRPLLSLLMIWNMLLAVPTALAAAAWAGVWAIVGGRTDPASPWREAGLVLVALPFFALLLATGVAVWQLGHFRIRRVRLAVPDLPAALRGFTIAHLSDLHLGKLTRGQVLDKIVAATNRLEADVIVFTGDLINMSLDDLPRALEMLRALKSRHGLFLCEGNHDLIQSRTGFEEAVAASGLDFLLNAGAVFSVAGQPVQILGLRWGAGMGRGRETVGFVPGSVLHRLLEQREPGDFTILLAHHPDAFDGAAEAGIPLTLSGHTHGGQLMFGPGIGFGPWLYRYWSGVYAKGRSRLVVSNGVGNWFPLRIFAPAEIIHLILE